MAQLSFDEELEPTAVDASGARDTDHQHSRSRPGGLRTTGMRGFAQDDGGTRRSARELQARRGRRLRSPRRRSSRSSVKLRDLNPEIVDDANTVGTILRPVAHC